ncbi:MAG: glycosyltransferase [Clostridia bacterium]|nr:glycosyltransferase [Clostridia bacterium]
MKILITTDLFTIETNGVVTSVKNLLKELKQKGHEVKVLTFSENIHSHQDGDEYYIRSIPFAVYPDIRMPVALRKYIRELVRWKPDVIHSQCEFFSFRYARLIAKKTGAPIVHTYHTLYEQYSKYVLPSQRLGNSVAKNFSRIRLRKVQNVVAPTHKVEETLRGYGLKNDISVVPSGIKLEQHKIRISKEERQKKRRELGISDDQIVLINLGRLGNEKNLCELVDYFSQAVKTRDNLVFMIVGDGPAKEGLEKQAKELGISDKVIFTGMVKPSQVQLYYQMGDIFVSASTSETQGLTYVEACANCLPLLCRRDQCLEEVLVPGENGYAYENQEEFLQHLDTMIKNPQWRVSAGNKSEQVADTFSTTAFGDAIEKIYKNVIR